MSKSKNSEVPRTPTPKVKRTRFCFTIERDIYLLDTALNINPWQLGEIKWKDVAENITTKYNLEISKRTVKARVEHLIEKFKKEELTTKTGTEEQASVRGKLIQEIIILLETEVECINDELGADDVEQIGEKQNKAAVKKDKIAADLERDSILDKIYPDTPSDPNSRRTKRTKAAMEEDLIMEKCRHDMMLEEKRFKLEESVRLADIEREDKKLELEFMREKRLSNESNQQAELFTIISQAFTTMKDVINSQKS